ncbi:MAG: signal peptidase I [Oscillospiraceae bacterium]|jgi:signal peptidase|nr:signal peptidase I [Oscillospiraceae bacterium]
MPNFQPNYSGAPMQPQTRAAVPPGSMPQEMMDGPVPPWADRNVWQTVPREKLQFTQAAIRNLASDLDDLLNEDAQMPYFLPQQQQAQPACAMPMYGTYQRMPMQAPAYGPPMGAYGPRGAIMQPQLMPQIKPGMRNADRKLANALSNGMNVLCWVVCVVLVFGAVLFAASKNPNKDFFGYRIYTVLTESMTPTPQEDGKVLAGGFLQGDAIIVQMCAPSDVQVGDVITFNPNPLDPEGTAYLTHRCVKILSELGGKEGTYFVTKGDHNKDADSPIAANMLIGKKVFAIPKIGDFMKYMRANTAVGITMFACFVGCVFMFRWYLADKRKQEALLSGAALPIAH